MFKWLLHETQSMGKAKDGSVTSVCGFVIGISGKCDALKIALLHGTAAPFNSSFFQCYLLACEPLETSKAGGSAPLSQVTTAQKRACTERLHVNTRQPLF